MATNKVHVINIKANLDPGWRQTFCGMIGAPENGNEYSTVMGNRFEAVQLANKDKVTCKSCAGQVRYR